MDALTPLDPLEALEPTPRGAGCLPGLSPTPPAPPSGQEPIKNEPQQEEVVDETTAAWQALGKKPVLAPASNPPLPGARVEPEDLARFEGEGGREPPAPAAPHPEKLTMP